MAIGKHMKPGDGVAHSADFNALQNPERLPSEARQMAVAASVDDAAYAIALSRFISCQRRAGESPSLQMVKNVAAMARIIRIIPRHTAFELGFSRDFCLPTDALRRFQQQVAEAQSGYLVDRLTTLLEDLTIADVERFEDDPEEGEQPSLGHDDQGSQGQTACY